MNKSLVLVRLLCLLALTLLPCVAGSQEVPPPEKVTDGRFEITTKTPDHRKIRVGELVPQSTELVRDRDLNPGAVFRVMTGGYLAFEEAEWVDKIEFKVFDRPVTAFEPYKRFAELLVDINEKIWGIKQTLGSYDQLAFRLMNICDKSRFPTLQSIDDNIVQQLVIYKRLMLLRELVVNSLNRFVKERSCRDRYDEYQKSLNLYSQQLTELSRNYERLTKKGLQLAQEVQPDQAAPERGKTDTQPLKKGPASQ
ncbi:MAG: hypothetical protein HY913_22430 [Desulfomonile tiedjei]|nr:hypothetical protein [Desulfomonile tiedjei]